MVLNKYLQMIHSPNFKQTYRKVSLKHTAQVNLKIQLKHDSLGLEYILYISLSYLPEKPKS